MKDPGDGLACMQKYGDCTTPGWLTGAERSMCLAEESAKQQGLLAFRLKNLEALLDPKTKVKLRAAIVAHDRFVQAQCALKASPFEGGSEYSRSFSTCANSFKEERLMDYQQLHQYFLYYNNR